MKNLLLLLPLAILLSACGNDSKNVVDTGVPGNPGPQLPGQSNVQVSALTRESTGFDSVKFIEPRLINGGVAYKFWSYGPIFSSWTNNGVTFDSHADAICAALAGGNFRYETHAESIFANIGEPGAVLQLINGGVSVNQLGRFGEHDKPYWNNRQSNKYISTITCTTSRNLGRNRYRH